MKSRNYQRGSALVEFAISATFILILLLGITEFGLALFTYDLVSNASRIGTRYAIVHGSDCAIPSVCPATPGQITAYVQANSPGVAATQLAVQASWPGGVGCTSPPTTPPTPYQGAGCPVIVTVQYPFKLLFFNFTTTMTSSSEMVISQ